MMSTFQRSTPYSQLTLAAACGLISLASAIGHAAEARPNVVLIMADDFGYECVSANGGQSYQTPHLDRLAAGGVRFEGSTCSRSAHRRACS
jgi:arylsulfatase A